MSTPTCRSEVELATLAPGMAKQHERYQDALQELIDNAVSSVVKDESYFDEPDESIQIVITLRRMKDTVRTTVADTGPGIELDALQNEIFRTGNKSVSDGILNNVGWGLKASLAWFEQTLSQAETTPEDAWFTLVTQTADDSPYRVNGPITGDLPISPADDEFWRKGLEIGNQDIADQETGTSIHVSCNRPKFDNDVWPSAKSLEIKAQTLRELLGVKFRRLLQVHSDNQIFIDYRDDSTGTSGSLEVVPILPEYISNDEDPPTPYEVDRFEVEGDGGAIFEIEYERGTLDFDTMTDQFADEHPGLFTTSGRFRTRYRPNQAKQGVDIYANGRVLMTSVFTDLFDLIRNNEYNYFGGEVRILPKNPDDEVPTDNKKIRIDTNSTLWQKLREKFSSDKYQPEGKRYDDAYEANISSDQNDSLENSNNGENGNDKHKPRESEKGEESHSISLKTREELFSIHQQDSRNLEDILCEFDEVPDNDGFVDVTVTSPPYFNLKDYGYEADQQVGQGDSYETYLDELRQVFRQVYNVTKDSGTLWVVVNTFKNNGEIVLLPQDIASVCQNLTGKQSCDECGAALQKDRLDQILVCSECEYTFNRKENSWLLQDIVIWNKTRALPYNIDGQFRNVFEYILCFSKSESFNFDVDKTRVADPAQFKKWWVEYPERYHPRGKVPDNIWEYVTPPQGSFGGIESLDHPAPFPTTLVERILRLTTQEKSIVLDPFAGSGTVPAVADIMGRRPIGFELSPKYCDAYDDVREEIEEKYGDRLKFHTSERQEELARVIGGLRQVKLVRELMRKLADEANLSSHRDLSIHTAFHVCRNIDVKPTNGDRFIEADFYYIVDDDLDDITVSDLEQHFRSIASNGISASYGVDPRIYVYSTNEFLAQTASQSAPGDLDKLYIYRNGRHYDYTEQIDLTDWVERTVGSIQWQQSFAQEEWPPIVSNLGLTVDNPRRKQNDVQEGKLFDEFQITGPDRTTIKTSGD